MIKVGIYGARGRMGQELCNSVLQSAKCELSYIYEHDSFPDLGRDFYDLILGSDKKELLKNSDIVIDFTSPEATLELLEENKSYKKGLVIGTTGLTDSQIKLLEDYSKEMPIVFSPNYSIGVNALLKLLNEAGKILSKEKDYDLEVVEHHHRYKKDSPSGTALKLAEVAASASGRNLSKDGVYGREGMVGERSIDEVGVFAVRAGDIIGEHTVTFCTLGERVEFTHKAHSRQTFSKGAVEAAIWLKNYNKGLFSMKEVLDL